MGDTIAVMITKGGVGKSTLVMALAETLSVYEEKSVLVIDSDAQASVSSMMMPLDQLESAQDGERTIVEYLRSTVVDGKDADWRDFLVGGVSDVDDAGTISLLPSQVHLTLLERDVAGETQAKLLRETVEKLLDEAKSAFDVVLIDCPPGLSQLTEAWMRAADHYISPTKPDYLGLAGLQVLKRFKEIDPDARFAGNLGVLVNMRDMRSPVDARFHEVLLGDEKQRCFENAIPANPHLQHAAIFDPDERSFMAKYPGETGLAIRRVTREMLDRLGADIASEPAPATWAGGREDTGSGRDTDGQDGGGERRSDRAASEAYGHAPQQRYVASN